MASGHVTAQTGRTHGCTDQPANVKKSLANSEPSTHGTKRTYRDVRYLSAFGGKADRVLMTLCLLLTHSGHRQDEIPQSSRRMPGARAGPPAGRQVIVWLFATTDFVRAFPRA